MPITAGLTLNFGCMNKRINSCADTFNFDFTVEHVYLKEGTSITKPTFIILKELNVQALPKFNYLECIEFDRKYWIKEVIQQAGRSKGSAYFMEIRCEVDVLASWKAAISSTPCYLKYVTAPSSLIDLRLDDDRLSGDIPLQGVEYNLLDSTFNPLLTDTPNSSNITFIVKCGIMGPGSQSNVIYALSANAFSGFFPALFTQSKFNTIASWNDFWDWTASKLGGVCLDPANFFDSVTIVPFDTSEFTHGTAVSQIVIGKIPLATGDDPDHKVPIPGILYGGPIEWKENIQEFEIDLSSLNDIYGYSDSDIGAIYYLRRKKYLTLTLVTPFGNIDISTDNYAYSEDKLKLKVKTLFELISGDVHMQLYDANTNEFLGKVNGNVAFNLGKLFNPGGTSNMYLNAAGSIASKLPLMASKMKQYDFTAEPSDFSKSVSKSISGFVGGNQTSSGASGGLVGNSSNGFLDYVLQCMSGEKNTQTGFYPLTDNSFFKVVATAYVPSVCKDYDTYKKYGKLFGYPAHQMVDNFNDIEDKSYVQCSNFDVAAAVDSTGMYPEEVIQINTYLNSGIYWEESTIEPDEPTP